MKDVKRPGYICIRNELRLAKSLPFVCKCSERASVIPKSFHTYSARRKPLQHLQMLAGSLRPKTSETVELDQKRSEA